MTKWRWWLIFAAIVAVVIADVHRRYRDSIYEYLYFRNHPDETVWAEEFNDANFQKVQKGMTRRAVIGLLGTPLESKDQVCGWDVTVYVIIHGKVALLCVHTGLLRSTATVVLTCISNFVPLGTKSIFHFMPPNPVMSGN